jgi:hypothetical protein
MRLRFDPLTMTIQDHDSEAGPLLRASVPSYAVEEDPEAIELGHMMAAGPACADALAALVKAVNEEREYLLNIGPRGNADMFKLVDLAAAKVNALKKSREALRASRGRFITKNLGE